MARKRRRTNWYFWGTVLGLVFAVATYVLIAAGLQTATSPYRFRDLVIPRFVDCLVIAWLFWVGSAIGSFLNVVAWRMPRGQSINGFSHCPRCDKRLSAQENWPVFGWIALRGRCRTCRLPISPRYPIVELVVGLTITLVGFVELYCGQRNLPYSGDAIGSTGPMSMPNLSREMLGISTYHLVAVACSWAFALVRFDDQKLPRSLAGWVLAIVILPMAFWAPVMIVPWQATVPEDWPNWTWLDALMRIVCALAAAALIGRSLARYLCPTADLKLDPMGRGTSRLIDLVLMLCVPSVVVGWQAVLGVVIVAAVLATWIQRLTNDHRDGIAWFAVSLPVAFSLQLVLWRPFEEIQIWPSSQSSPWVILIAAALILVVPAGLRDQPKEMKPKNVTMPPDKDPESNLLSEESD